MSLELFFPVSPQVCEYAVKNWIEVRILRQLPLQGGVSGANVYSIDAELLFPTLEEGQCKPLEFVIKFSSEQDFEREKENYRQLPERLKKWFVDFATQRKLIEGNFFLIMPHLSDYKTLAYILYHEAETLATDAAKKTWEALEDIHFRKDEDRDPCKKKKPSLGKLAIMYLADVYLSIQKTDRLVSYFPGIRLESLQVNGEKLHQPSFYLEQLWKISDKIAPCFSMWTHGDCHSRNIMIRLSDTDLKFIDVDQLHYDGDYIYDFGALLADIEVYNRILQCRRPDFSLTKKSSRSYSYAVPEMPKETQLATDFLREKLMNFVTKELKDNQLWERRLDLARARYLLNMSSKTIDYERAFIVYCEGLRALASATNTLQGT